MAVTALAQRLPPDFWAATHGLWQVAKAIPSGVVEAAMQPIFESRQVELQLAPRVPDRLAVAVPAPRLTRSTS